MELQELLDTCHECIISNSPLIIVVNRRFRGQQYIRFAGKKGGPLGHVLDEDDRGMLVEFDPRQVLSWIANVA
jgi:hypothetical protein